MKLYSKKLNSVEELKREKHVLKYALKHSGSDDWLNLNNLGSSDPRTENAAGAGVLGTVISAFGNKSMLNTILAMAPPVISLATKRRRKPEAGFLQRAAREVVTGYIKWKAIQMVYRGIMMVVKSNKEDEEEKQDKKVHKRHKKERM